MHPLGGRLRAVRMMTYGHAWRGFGTKPAPMVYMLTFASIASCLACAKSARDRGPCPSDMVATPRSCIDRHEASEGPRGEAVSTRCVLPWVGVTVDAAPVACLAAGKHLCTGSEWFAACTRLQGWRFPYGETFDPDACNTHEYGVAHGSVAIRPTGSVATCEGGFPGIFDMAGNAAERVEAAGGVAWINGGSYLDAGSGSLGSCVAIVSDARPVPYVGFRCCKDLPPGAGDGGAP